MRIIKKWNSMSLILRILIGLAVGAILGFSLPQATWIGIPGELFVGALKAIAPILVFVLVASSLANSKGGNMKKFRTVIVLYLFSTLCAAVVTVFTSFAFKVTIPLSGIDAMDASAASLSMVDVVLNLLKSIVINPVDVLANANYIGILFWAVVFGIALKLVPPGCSLFGIGDDIAMQLVGAGFIISVVQDSLETALNSSGDVLFTAAAEFHQWKKQGRSLPL